MARAPKMESMKQFFLVSRLELTQIPNEELPIDANEDEDEYGSEFASHLFSFWRGEIGSRECVGVAQ